VAKCKQDVVIALCRQDISITATVCQRFHLSQAAKAHSQTFPKRGSTLPLDHGPPSVQLGGLGSVVSFTVGFKANSHPQTHFCAFWGWKLHFYCGVLHFLCNVYWFLLLGGFIWTYWPPSLLQAFCVCK